MPYRIHTSECGGADISSHPLHERLLSGLPPGENPVTHVRTLPARVGTSVEWPDWAPPAVLDALVRSGIPAPWAHQRRAAELARGGADVLLATGTASGKSLAYQLPALAELAGDDHTRVLYLSPTKALAGDQLRSLTGLELAFLRAATFDGDTPTAQRDWVRAHANWVLTNPDMLSIGILPGHQRWASYLRRLRYVVVDECHHYRGVFGAHVAAVLRRLRRVCARYGATPTFVLASATVSNAADLGRALLGTPVQTVAEDASPRGARTFALWEPPLTALRGENDAPVRRAATTEAGRVLADLVVEGARTLAFVRSRRGAESAALGAQRHLREADADALAGRVAAYRAGYLPEERRALEAALQSGELLGLATTNALELGVDISGLDAVVLAGYPGTLASLWQQSGRAGRSGRDALVVFVARDDPLDTYLVHHPEALFDRPVEANVFDPANPYVLAPQLGCAAFELPLQEDELALFARDGDVALVRDVVDQLEAARLLRRRPGGWFWTGSDRPRADIRGGLGAAVSVVEAGTGTLIGTVDGAAAHATVHDGAVYLHQGASYVVDTLDLTQSVALVHRENPDWSTTAREVTDIAIVGTEHSRGYGPVSVHFGTVDVTHQVVGYTRKRLSTGEFIDETPLDLPPRQLRSRSVWYTIAQEALDEIGIEVADVPGAAHAAEHAAIGLLPLVATCDRWDIGGVSTALHADTGRPTVFVYDGYPGGAGFAERGHAVIDAWLQATRDAIVACECATGCPSCVQSPKCGNGNDPLDKAGAVGLLELVLAALDAPSDP